MANRREDFVDTDFETPLGTLEQAVADISAEVLEVDRISRSDSFYDFGATSLQAIRICARIERQIGIQAQPIWLFSYDILAEFVQLLQADGAAPDE